VGFDDWLGRSVTKTLQKTLEDFERLCSRDCRIFPRTSEDFKLL
jgi:hypothetical protein